MLNERASASGGIRKGLLNCAAVSIAFAVVLFQGCQATSNATYITKGSAGETTASIDGTVTTDGSPLPGATVTIASKGMVRTAVTGIDGRYSFPFIAPGDYVVRVELAGMSPISRTIRLAAADHAHMPCALNVSAVAEAITVTAATPASMAAGSFTVGGGSSYHAPRAAPRPAANSVPAAVFATSSSNNAGMGPVVEASVDEYRTSPDNVFKAVYEQPFSTFAIDVDTASYTNARRFLQSGSLPPAEAVRIEEFVNYFTYDYPEPAQAPVGITAEIADCPWERTHRLLRVGLQARHVALDAVPPGNFVFLVDVSGSMDQPDKLPLVQQAMHYLTDELRKEDRVAIVVYAGSAGLVLPVTAGDQKSIIYSAIDQLRAGGSTAGGEGILLAYKIATENFIRGGNNRVVLATDGDFNIGVSRVEDLEGLITEEKKSGVFLSVLGVGQGNLKDARMEALADKGNGNYSYLDGLDEAKRVLAEEFAGTMLTVAKDVKVQLFFNPRRVAKYRLVGYENRMLNKEDFTDDLKDGGEMGAGHSVTALYELVAPGTDPADQHTANNTTDTDELSNGAWDPGHDEDLVRVSVRYKEPAAENSQEISQYVRDSNASTYAASESFRMAAAAAEFAMLLRDSPDKGASTFEEAKAMAQSCGKIDAKARLEFMKLTEIASSAPVQQASAKR